MFGRPTEDIEIEKPETIELKVTEAEGINLETEPKLGDTLASQLREASSFVSDDIIRSLVISSLSYSFDQAGDDDFEKKNKEIIDELANLFKAISNSKVSDRLKHEATIELCDALIKLFTIEEDAYTLDEDQITLTIAKLTITEIIEAFGKQKNTLLLAVPDELKTLAFDSVTHQITSTYDRLSEHLDQLTEEDRIIITKWINFIDSYFLPVQSEEEVKKERSGALRNLTGLSKDLESILELIIILKDKYAIKPENTDNVKYFVGAIKNFCIKILTIKRIDDYELYLAAQEDLVAMVKNELKDPREDLVTNEEINTAEKEKINRADELNKRSKLEAAKSNLSAIQALYYRHYRGPLEKFINDIFELIRSLAEDMENPEILIKVSETMLKLLKIKILCFEDIGGGSMIGILHTLKRLAREELPHESVSALLELEDAINTIETTLKKQVKDILEMVLDQTNSRNLIIARVTKAKTISEVFSPDQDGNYFYSNPEIKYLQRVASLLGIELLKLEETKELGSLKNGKIDALVGLVVKKFLSGEIAEIEA